MADNPNEFQITAINSLKSMTSGWAVTELAYGMKGGTDGKVWIVNRKARNNKTGAMVGSTHEVDERGVTKLVAEGDVGF